MAPQPTYHDRVSLSTASIWRRTGAFALDYVVIALWIGLVVGLGVLMRGVATELADDLFGNPLTAELAGFVTLTLPVALYFAVSEQGAIGGTWGKRRRGLRVVTDGGAPLSLGRSVLRTALKLVPWELAHAVIWRFAIPDSAPELLLDAGLVVVWGVVAANLLSALLDDRRRTLSDRLSGTRVIVR
jgi:uncharacterized RDD family membrane protein YckC